MTKSLTGLIYDTVFLKHDQSGHPESAKRLMSILTLLEEKQLIKKLTLVNSRKAEVEELSICHTKEYVQYVKDFCENGGGYLDPDTYANKESFLAAATAVGSTIDLTKEVIDGTLKNGFALLRPPGHHALANRAMGFCLFGNIAIASKAALLQPGINKVAIVDFDVHHGNGTQALIGDDPNILFISTHQYPFYPGSGSIREIGTGDAEGTVINIPLQAGAGDKAFKTVFDEIVIPSLQIFHPDLILVSAGYDAHWDDPLANLNLSLAGYDWITKQLINSAKQLCEGKIIFFLEGGYNLDVLGFGVTNAINRLSGVDSFEDPIGKINHTEPDITQLLNELKKIHSL